MTVSVFFGLPLSQVTWQQAQLSLTDCIAATMHVLLLLLLLLLVRPCTLQPDIFNISIRCQGTCKTDPTHQS
jgi:hypothetical protein